MTHCWCAGLQETATEQWMCLDANKKKDGWRELSEFSRPSILSTWTSSHMICRSIKRSFDSYKTSHKSISPSFTAHSFSSNIMDSHFQADIFRNPNESMSIWRYCCWFHINRSMNGLLKVYDFQQTGHYSFQPLSDKCHVGKHNAIGMPSMFVRTCWLHYFFMTQSKPNRQRIGHLHNLADANIDTSSVWCCY